MPPIVSPEERASFIHASPAEKPLPRGFVAAVPTSRAPSTPLSPPTLQPPPPSHYLRNKNRSSEDSDLFIKRSEIFTRVQRVLPSASHAEDSISGLLFGTDFHTDWTNTRLGRSTLSSPRSVVASPIHTAHTPAAPLSAEPPSMVVQSNSISNGHSVLPPRARDEDGALEASPSVPVSSEAPSKDRPSRGRFRTLLCERLTVKVASRTVEAAFTSPPSSSTDDLPRFHSTELDPLLSQQYATAGPPSPGSSASSIVYEPSCWSSETDTDKKNGPWQKGSPPTPPSPFPTSLHTPPSASLSLLEAQRVRRAKACDKFTRYSETTPFQSPRSTLNNTAQTATVPVQVPALTLCSARETPTESPVQVVQWTSAIELHRVSSAPNLQLCPQSQPQPQPQPRPQPRPQPPSQPRLNPQRKSHSQSQLYSRSRSQSQSQLIAPQHTPPPPLSSPPPLPPSFSHATSTSTPTITTTAPAPAPKRKLHRASPYRQSTGVLIPRPSVGSLTLKAILRPRSHSKPVLTGVH